MSSEPIPNRTRAADQEPILSFMSKRRKSKFGSYKYLPEFADMVYELLSTSDEAKTKAHLCQALQCSKDTLLKWMRTYPEFKQAVEEGLRVGEIKWRKKIADHAWEPSAKVNNGLIKLLSANVYGIKEEKDITLKGDEDNPLGSKVIVEFVDSTESKPEIKEPDEGSGWENEDDQVDDWPEDEIDTNDGWD